MADRQIAEFGLADIATTGTLDHLLGQEKDFKHESKSGNTYTLLSASRVRARWVKNREGAALSKNQAVTYKSTYYGLGVELADTGNKCAGVVSPMLERTVPDGSYCWIVTEGPAKAISDGNSTIAQGEAVITIGSGTGKVRKQVAAPADTTAALVQLNSVVGSAMEAVAATDGLAFNVWVHPGRQTA